MDNNNAIILYENEDGIRMIRTDMKKRSRLDKVNRNGYKLNTYRMNNIPFYDHKYLSWKNLDHCCKSRGEYLNTAVQKDLKLVAGIAIDINDEKEIQAKLDGVRETLDLSKENAELYNVLSNGPRKWILVTIARKGTLSDFYDIKEIIQVYLKQNIEIDESALEEYFNVELMDLFTGNYRGFDYANPRDDIELVVDGLGLGYPIESTASIIYRDFGHI